MKCPYCGNEIRIDHIPRKTILFLICRGWELDLIRIWYSFECLKCFKSKQIFAMNRESAKRKFNRWAKGVLE